MTKKPCLDCRTPTQGTRCKRCTKHKKTNPAYRDPIYQRNRATLINAWIETFGYVCPGVPALDIPGHTLNAKQRLSADHIIPLAQGGTHDLDNLTVRCTSCNSRRGNATKGQGGLGL